MQRLKKKKTNYSDVGVNNDQNVPNLNKISSSLDTFPYKNTVIDKLIIVLGVNNTTIHAGTLEGLNPEKI